MQNDDRRTGRVVIRGAMWLSASQPRRSERLDAEILVAEPYRHICSIEIERPYDEDVDAWITKVEDVLKGNDVSVSAVIADGNLRTTIADISPIIVTSEGDDVFDETARTRIGLLDDLFDTLKDLDRNPDDLPTRPGSCALVIATFAPFIERLDPIRCETSPIGGVIVAIEGPRGTVSVHAMPQGHMTITGQGAWNASARHDVPSAQNALREMLDLG